MLIIHKAAELQKKPKSRKTSLGLVPTMGALHAGHLSLIERAVEENTSVVVSIYVNPTQFNRNEDLENYPKNLEEDLEMLKPFSKQLILYVPNHDDLYPEGIQSKHYDFGSLSQFMEGDARPGHFDGVATIVEALFQNIKPNKAYFGEKDFQQLQIIKALNETLNLEIEIVSCPLLRSEDGLALSSRNRLMSDQLRSDSKIIYQTLNYIAEEASDWSVSQMEVYFKSKIAEKDNFKVDYFCIADPNDLIPIRHLDSRKNYRIFVALYAGKTRLIDTIELARK